MANFWEYESKESNRARKAAAWTEQAKEDAWEFLGHETQRATGLSDEAVKPISRGSMFEEEKDWSWDSEDTDSIEKPSDEPKRGGNRGVLRGALGLVDDAASAVFAGKVRQPWDLLRPVQRALEAEQKYVARPLAKAALGWLPGEYDDLPGIVRSGAEVLFDPLTYMGPGAISAVAKGARLMPAAVKMGVPGIEALVKSPGSRRAFQHVIEQAGFGISSVVGGTLADELGLPAIGGAVAGPMAFGRLRNKVTGSSQARVVGDEAVEDFMGWNKQNTGNNPYISQLSKMTSGQKVTISDSLGFETDVVRQGDRYRVNNTDGLSLDEAVEKVTNNTSPLPLEPKSLEEFNLLDRSDVKQALKSEDEDLNRYFGRGSKTAKKTDDQMTTNLALSTSKQGRDILTRKTKGEQLTGKDYEFIANALKKANNPSCQQ